MGMEIQAQRIIVIHPGSLNLRIGRASDLNPITIIHAIGRRRKHATKGQSNHQDPILPALIPKENIELMSEFEEQRLQVSNTIQSHIQHQDERGGGTKRIRVATPLQQIASFNRRCVPVELPAEDEDEKKGEANMDSDLIFGQQLLQLSSDTISHYNIHFPMRRGEMHLHSNVGGSLTAVLADLESIWRHAIHEYMGITPEALTQYSAVLVISDIYSRSILREMVTLLLQRLRFRACFLVQDHVAATFGAGLGYACVVDVGDQKCSVSCVEDGISQPDTRVRLGYGGGDVTQVFYALLRECSFPYKECDPDTSFVDAALLMQLKERFCHLSLDTCGVQEKTFDVKRATKLLRYTFQQGDECVVAPLSLFHTELLNITGKHLVRTQLRSSQEPDAEDCFDAEYIRETGRVRNGRGDQLLEGTLPAIGDAADDELVVVDAYDVEERVGSTRNSDKEEQLYYMSNNGQIVPLDLAIVRSVERCGSEEMKRKMYGCILLVGGSSKFPGFAKWLEQKVTLQLAASTTHRSIDQVPFEVNVCTKDMDAAMIAWKGAAIMSCLESAPELWLYAGEWEKYGLRILREKATFIW